MNPVQVQTFSERALVDSVRAQLKTVRALLKTVRAPMDLERAPVDTVQALVDTKQIQWAALWIQRALLRIFVGPCNSKRAPWRIHGGAFRIHRGADCFEESADCFELGLNDFLKGLVDLSLPLLCFVGVELPRHLPMGRPRAAPFEDSPGVSLERLPRSAVDQPEVPVDGAKRMAPPGTAGRGSPRSRSRETKRLAPICRHTGPIVSAQRNPPFLQRRHSRQQSEIPVHVQYRDSVPNRAGSDQAVDARPDRYSGSPGTPIELRGFFEDLPAQRSFEDRKGEHRLPGDAKGVFLQKSLEDLLNDRQAGDHLIQVDDGPELKSARPPENLDPKGGIYQEHRDLPERSGRRRGIAPHLGKVAFPQTRPCKFQDSSSPVPPQVVLHGLGDCPRVGPLPAHTGQLFQEVLIQHKIRALHAHSILERHLTTYRAQVAPVQIQRNPVQARTFSERALVNSVRAQLKTVRALMDLERAPVDTVQALVDTKQIQWAALWIQRALLRIFVGPYNSKRAPWRIHRRAFRIHRGPDCF